MHFLIFRSLQINSSIEMYVKHSRFITIILLPKFISCKGREPRISFSLKLIRKKQGNLWDGCKVSCAVANQCFTSMELNQQVLLISGW